jgi:hypothetical protein
MTDEEFTREQMNEQRKEVSRLRSELKAFNKTRATMSKEDKERTRQQAKDLQDRYDRALGRLYTMRNYFLWNRCVDREYISAYDKD